MPKFQTNINLETATDIQFKNTSGTNTGKIEADGNIILASGHGLDFSANTQASGMTSELLHNYEEGNQPLGFVIG